MKTIRNTHVGAKRRKQKAGGKEAKKAGTHATEVDLKSYHAPRILGIDLCSEISDQTG